MGWANNAVTLDNLRALHPGWNIWVSDSGTDWYATRRRATGLEKRDATLVGPSLEELAARLWAEDPPAAPADAMVNVDHILAAFGD